jgi:hypothetical protein
MSEDSFRFGQPDAVVEPVAPLLRGQAARRNVVAADEVVLPASEVNQFQIVLHTSKEAHRAVQGGKQASI